MSTDSSEEQEPSPSLRLCLVARPSQGSCGFHLSRTQWDPYPWVSEVELGSPADKAGLVVGDCVLEVNGEDVLGLRIGAVALRVYARGDQVRLLVWNSGVEYTGAIWAVLQKTSVWKPALDAAPRRQATEREGLLLSGEIAGAVCDQLKCAGSGPTPLSLQRLASCLQSVVSLLECPVCLETIPPPAFQCCNGHTLCSGCRSLTDRCPVCRVALGPRGRCLLADKLHALFSTTFLQPVSRKQKRSKTWNRQMSNTQAPSRPKPRTILPSTQKAPASSFYPCPLNSCGSPVKGSDLVYHLQRHEGPLVQYFCKDSSTFLRFPVTRLTTITLSQGSTFLLHVCHHPTAGCLLLWLWTTAEDASSYRLQLDLPGLTVVRGCVFPLSWSTQQVLDDAADRCVVLDDHDFDSTCTKVKITILSKSSSVTI